MSKKITQILKLILVGFSLYLCYLQYKVLNTALILYWIVVALYWLFNYLSGITPKNK